MKFSSSVWLVLIIWSMVSANHASAQLFGPRNIGRNSRGQQLTSRGAAGVVGENRRFVRGQRAASNFVGADRDEAAAFVGNTLATNDGEVTDSVTGLREQPTVRVNRARVRKPTGLYSARLSPAFTTRLPGTGDSVEKPVFSVALNILSEQQGFQVSLSPTERSALLTGTVRTEHDRQIAEILVMLEPGLENVKNDLQVVP
ncbi:MAG: hypothetical protein GY826_02145 [Fuerstiella sp.]|nr:hypothetical protein [Fuerstiella sp.]